MASFELLVVDVIWVCTSILFRVGHRGLIIVTIADINLDKIIVVRRLWHA